MNNAYWGISMARKLKHINIRCICETSLLYFEHAVKQSVSHLPILNIFLTVILHAKQVYQRKNVK